MRLSKLAAVLLTVSACASVPPASARAQIAFAPCKDSNNFACGHLTVPLDPSGGTPGTITLAIRRHRAPIEGGSDAIVALAGGPGQSAIPLAEQFGEVLGPIADTRDEIIFDQRGTGLSGPLSCPALEKPGAARSPGVAIATCANQIGSKRAFFTTANSVADIEALRRAGGYDKLVLYGTSYGTKVAEQYAQTYPSHVEALVLDSVVPPNGPDPLNRSTFAAIPRILAQLCAEKACAHITGHPTADLAKVVKRMGRGVLHGRWIDGYGRAHRIGASSDDLAGILVEGDLNPTLRADFPAAVRAAANGDTAALARLKERVQSGQREPVSSKAGFDIPLYLTTVCEELSFPWSRSASFRTRMSEATTRVDALSPASLAPFGPLNALDLSDIRTCAPWPFATRTPETDDAPFPSVPTLILSGADDLRTPTANARELAAEIPGSQLLVVPNVGHSVLGSDLSSCSSDALQALFAGKPIQACGANPSPGGGSRARPLMALLNLLERPTPLPPRRLADVPPARGSHGLPGRTLRAVVLTLADTGRQLLLQGAGGLASGGLRVGGLRAGWVDTAPTGAAFHGLSYVPGVTLSGRLLTQGTLRIGGSAAARGVLHFTAKGTMSGVLGGERVHLSAASAAVAEAAQATRVASVARTRRLGEPFKPRIGGPFKLP